ncbi:hypothetical protein Y032_0266g721 [Ancylostoma ceylanicum]|uniref:Uncharacterized protein n=1 Tax=Ancylostoma ceylanicum TaxID=53326 RepID=A0A016S9C1_9BILA|nr:hypothetical protein Y032_0266g721 [Ancylostoma ceylanicum]
MYSELQTSIDKGRDRGAALLCRDTGALHPGSGCLLRRGTQVPCCWQKQTARGSTQGPCVTSQERRAAVPPLVCGRLEFTLIRKLTNYQENPIVCRRGKNSCSSDAVALRVFRDRQRPSPLTPTVCVMYT